MSASYETLKIEIRSAVKIIRIDRQKSLNALNIQTISELQNEINISSSDQAIRCVIITGAGEKAFVAGADIKEIADLNGLSGADFSARGQQLMTTIQNFPRPVIAAVNGFALGGGCELAMACDIRLASEKAKLGLPEVNLGLLPGYCGTQRLPRLVGRGKAMQLIMTGEMISANEAHRIGLVDEVYPADQLMEKSIAMAELISSKAPLAVGAAKDAVNRGLDTNLEAGCELEKGNFGLMCGSEDKIEGITAFLEKRNPEFKNR